MLPFPSPGGLPDPGIKPRSPTLQADTLPSEPPGNPYPFWINSHQSRSSGLACGPVFKAPHFQSWGIRFDWETKILTYCNVWHGQKIKLKKFLNMFLSLKKKKGRNRKELPQPVKEHL